jgi:hypothetical protein
LTYLVSPAAESSTGVDILSLELGEELFENTLTLQRWSGVTVVKTAVVGRNDFVIWSDHLGVDETLDGISHDVGLVNRLH